MGFKKIRYHDGDNIMKIRIEDDSGGLMENWTIKMSDLGKWVNIMHHKYGIELSNKKKLDEDLDWIR